MNTGRRWMTTLGLVLGLAILPLSAMAEGETPASDAAAPAVQTQTASDIVTQLGVLKGDGQGVTDAYLIKSTTRLQAAILMLRLIGKEQEALGYEGTSTFLDASKAGKASQPVLAYLKNHPELGWGGTGSGSFEPNAAITAQQIYKVMMESLNYRSETDFAFKDSLAFAAEQGLFRAADAATFTNRDLAVALAETLQTVPRDGMHSLLHELIDKGIVSADNGKALDGLRIDIGQTSDGASYLTDGRGMALYLFTKDMADLNSCLAACLTNWPVAYSDRLIIPDGLDAKDFGAFVRTDGAKQLTYQGWPLYYFVKDGKAGDVNGEGVGDVWYLVKQPFYTVGLGTDAKLGHYLVDSSGVSLYYFDKDPMGKSVCEGDCLKKWPAFHADSIIAPKGLKTEDFGEITRSDGAKQTTYKGYPLYYFIQDAKRGELKGQAAGDIWFVVNPTTFAGTTAGKDTPAPVVAEKVTVEMKEYSFTPTVLTVKAGTTIEFVNRDDMKHNAVATDGTFKTELLEKGQSATIKLDKPGTYEYFCEPHKSFMKGTIIVQ